MPASRTRRLGAAAIDVAATLFVAILLSSTLGGWFEDRTHAAFGIGEPGSAWRGSLPLVLGYLGGLVYGLPLAGILLLLPEAVFGSSPGKTLLGLRIAAAGGGGSSTVQRFVRFGIKTDGLLLFTLGLILELGPLALAGFVVCLLALAGSAPALLPGGRALHDRLAGTVVD